MINHSLSVIITFYNEVEFLDLALTSVRTQSIDGMEIIIVNDNPDVFDDSFFDDHGYSKHARILHHDVNKGLSAARNTGILAATGTHIAFLDADDYYLPGGLKQHYNFACENGADITHAHTIIKGINSTTGNVLWSDKRIMKNSVVLEGQDRLTGALARVSSWASIYRRDFLINKNVMFDVAQRKFEDRLFIVQSMIAAEKIAIFAKPVRIWRRRANSITTSRKTLDETAMKLGMFEKCTWAWRDSDVPDRRNFQCAEFIRHILNIMIQDDFSEVINDKHAEAHALKLRLQAFAAGEKITREEIQENYNTSLFRFTTGETGRGKVSADDLFSYITALIAGDTDTTNAISLKCTEVPTSASIASLVPTGDIQPDEKRTFDSNIQVYVHFGTHKTGSTYIQQQLGANRDVLKKHGILYPKTGEGFSHDRGPVREGGLPGHQGLLVAAIQGDVDVLAALHDEIAESKCHKIIISAENLCVYKTDEPGVNEQSILTRLNALDLPGKIIPVIYFRRPDRWIESFYREQVGNGAGTAYQIPDEYFNNQQNRLNYAATVQTIENALGQTARLAQFDAVLKDEGLLPSFLRLCDAEGVAADINLSEEATQYPSPCNAQIKISRLVSTLIPSGRKRENVLRDFYRLSAPTNQKSPLMSLASQRKAIEIFEDTSAEFFAERGLVMDTALWKSGLPNSQPTDTAIPEAYVDILSQIGVLQTPAKKTGPLRKRRRRRSRQPMPIRVFTKFYKGLTRNRVYKTIRRLGRAS